MLSCQLSEFVCMLVANAAYGTKDWYLFKSLNYLLFCQVISISKLLNTLPEYSSAVITSADSLITELFTHKGMSWTTPCENLF